MTDDQINRLWLQSQDDAEGMRLGFTTQHHYFAALVAAAEREACAKLCEDIPLPQDATALTHLPTIERCAAAIRSRGQE